MKVYVYFEEDQYEVMGYAKLDDRPYPCFTPVAVYASLDRARERMREDYCRYREIEGPRDKSDYHWGNESGNWECYDEINPRGWKIVEMELDESAGSQPATLV